jgi:DNA-binding MarR family transcriptional regulator
MTCAINIIHRADWSVIGIFNTVNKSRLTYRQYVVLTAIDEGAICCFDIQKLTGIDGTTCQAIIDRLIAKNFTRRVGRHSRCYQYALTSAGALEMKVAQRSESKANDIIMERVGRVVSLGTFVKTLQEFVFPEDQMGRV